MDFKPYIRAHADELLQSLAALIRIPSVEGTPEAGAPYGREVARCLHETLALCERLGFPTVNMDDRVGWCEYGKGEEMIAVLGHLDVVPAGDGWNAAAPFSGEVKDGRIYGRGTMDDKGPALCALYAMRAVRDAGVELRDGVRLILGCDEETGMSDMRHYAARTKLPDYGFSPDAEFPVINIEKGGLGLLLSAFTGGEGEADLPVYSLYAGERPNVVPGIARAEVGTADFAALQAAVARVAAEKDFKLTCENLGGGRAAIVAEGVSAHASMPHLGKNAAGMLLIALKALEAGGNSRGSIAALADVLGLQYDGAALGIAQADELSGALTCNLGILRYDGAHLTAQLDIRYPLCADEAKMCGAAAMALSGTGLALTRLNGHTPHHVPAEHKIVRGLLQVYHEVTGRDAYAFAIGGGTYSRMMPNTVAFGLNFPGDTDTCHMPDEYIDIEKMMLSVRIFAHAIAALASGEID